MTEYIEKVVGDYHGQHLIKFEIINDSGYKLSVLNYGATWYGWSYMTDDYKEKQLLYQLPTFEEYITNPYHVGHSIGRVAGRIKQAKFRIGDRNYTLPPNNNGNLLHSNSIEGFDSYFWQGNFNNIDNYPCIVFTTQASQDGFPGVMDVKITYQLLDDGHVKIYYQALSDEDTLFDPTTHVYFNFNGNQTIDNMKLKINSKQRLETDENNLPTGRKILNRDGYDFSKLTCLKEQLSSIGNGQLDDAFEVIQNEVAVVLEEDNQKIEIKSDRNCAVIFTANPLENNESYTGLAVEMQTLPDAISNPDFGNVIISANNFKTYITEFKIYK